MAAGFKSILFADQSLAEVLQGLSPPASDLKDALTALRTGNPAETEVILGTVQLTRPNEFRGWHRLILAASRLAREDPAGALPLIRDAANLPGDSRVRLWAWRALRDLGQPPAEDAAARVLGVIVEVEVGAGIDTLAAYDDLSARYLLHTGARVIWDNPDARLRPEIQAVLAAAGALAPSLEVRTLEGDPAASAVRTTLLTPAGRRSVEEPLADVAGDASPRSPLFATTTALLEKILGVARW